MTNTRVSVPLMPALGCPAEPYASAGGATIITRLPTLTPGRPSSHALISCPTPTGKAAGRLRCQEESNSLPEAQIWPTYCTTSSWPFATAGPEPWMSVVTDVLVGAAVFGMVIVGFWFRLVSETVGNAPPPELTAAPDGPALLL